MGLARGTDVAGGVGQDSVDIPDTKVACTSIIMLGWPSDRAQIEDDGAKWYSWDADLPGLPSGAFAPISDGFEKECSERRDTYLGFLALVAIPTTVLMSAAISRRSKVAD